MTGEDTDNTPEMIETEIDIMNTLRHPGIVQFISAFIAENYYIVIMEYMNASLTDLLDYKKHPPLTEKSIAYISKCTLEALNYLHSMLRIHRG